MNLFVFSKRPRRNAQLYCDQHVRKILLELTQMLYTAYHALLPVSDVRAWLRANDAPGGGYRPTHVDHPVTRWVRATPQNYRYAATTALALCDEFEHRFGKPHACRRHVVWLVVHTPFNDGACDASAGARRRRLTPFAQAMPGAYKDPTSAKRAYRRYARAEKRVFANGRSMPTWTRRPVPRFMLTEQ